MRVMCYLNPKVREGSVQGKVLAKQARLKLPHPAKVCDFGWNLEGFVKKDIGGSI